ncbi:MAG TPA: hypothetical protein VIN58_25380 [Roseateles sp.]
MAHPDPHRAGAERNQRRHAGQTGEASDLGRQDKSQSRPGTHAAERRSDDVGSAPESGEKPQVRTPDGPARR